MSTPLRAIGLTALALVCFAGNSLLCRLALAAGHIDAASFTAVRLASGAAVLALLARGRPPSSAPARARWISAAALFAYAAPFSLSYLRVGAAIGALVLFATVQVTMLTWAVVRGERPSVVGWLGSAIALGGLGVLTIPGKSAPDPLGTVGMVIAGFAWAVYTLRGRTVQGDPVVTTAASFLRSLPFVALLFGIAAATTGFHASPRGVLLAALSGAIASGVGYSVWYAALRHLSATRAAVLQLVVPILAAMGAVAFLGESVSARLAGASVAILGGVAATIWAKSARG